ncbi:hypothetical protein QTP70_030697 [Hemibagrus guttatus]|uniref:ribonuclease H n=1 Tax=Hemibagrus guttatus TaxID=175788 RepID=A0AAE0V0B4_9TELE|nr:hypothetical protein QTP70_030697 [Hemibagrus guttatus]
MSLKLETEGVMLNVVSGYAPQVLDKVMESIPTGERVVIGADFNGHVGEENTGDEEVMGKFGVKERNLEGQMVVYFAKRMDMAVVNTYFQKREEHRVTYKSGGRRTQADYILCRRGNLKEISDCKVVVGESVARQHRMVVCRMTFMVCKMKRSKIEIEKKTKWWKLKKEECFEEFRQKLRQALGGQVVLPDDWETTAEVIRKTGRKVLGVSSGRRKEDKETWWWNEEVQDSIQRKRLAYDRVPREELWYCMRKSGVAEKYVRVVQDMYERSRTVVRCAVGQTEEFKVEVGLHQGSALSPFLFAIVMDQLSEEVRQESPWTMMFADDIVICSESREQVEENLERWRFALERRGMKVSRSKTEYMCVNEREGSGTVRLQGEEVKKVQEFKYLGSTVQSNGECGKEVKKRVQAGWNGWRKVSGVLCDRKISARIKGKVYRTVVRPAMLYGLETVSLRKRQESELEVAELKMLRFSFGVTRLDRIRNEYIRGTAHVGCLGDKVREARLRWFGHVQRRESEYIGRRMLYGYKWSNLSPATRNISPLSTARLPTRQTLALPESPGQRWVLRRSKEHREAGGGSEKQGEALGGSEKQKQGEWGKARTKARQVGGTRIKARHVGGVRSRSETSGVSTGPDGKGSHATSTNKWRRRATSTAEQQSRVTSTVEQQGRATSTAEQQGRATSTAEQQG